MEHNENLQVKAYRLAYDEAFANAKNAYNYEQKEAWVAEAVKYAKLIEEVYEAAVIKEKQYNA
jgi:formylmethanofuran dehydrogenase subunit E-like metal-binding protein